MKLAAYNWNVRIVKEQRIIIYQGFKTKHEAIEFAEDWNARHPNFLIEVVKYVNGKWEVAI